MPNESSLRGPVSSVHVHIDNTLTLFEKKRKGTFQTEGNTEDWRLCCLCGVMLILTSAQERRVVCLSQQDVILKCVVRHCFQQPKQEQLMSCSPLIMFPPFGTSYCCFLLLHFIIFLFLFWQFKQNVWMRLFHHSWPLIGHLFWSSVSFSARVREVGIVILSGPWTSD